MSDDWRVRIDLHEEGAAHSLIERLEAAALEHGLDTEFEDRVAVSRDGAEVFCYAGTREQAQRTLELVRSLAADNGWQAEPELRHWHPSAESWEAPDTPLPQNDAERAAEHAALIAREREETAARGYPEFEVRVHCASRHEASQLAEKLRGQGIPSVHRWNYLLVGAIDEDSASALAERLRQAAPAGSTVTVEGSAEVVLAEQPRNPFAFLGGLGG